MTHECLYGIKQRNHIKPLKKIFKLKKKNDNIVNYSRVK